MASGSVAKATACLPAPSLVLRIVSRPSTLSPISLLDWSVQGERKGGDKELSLGEDGYFHSEKGEGSCGLHTSFHSRIAQTKKNGHLHIRWVSSTILLESNNEVIT